jgi:triphosphoribosyl-dephospho-CoA synthase
VSEPSWKYSITPAMACIWEVTARKLGNVHPGATFAEMEYVQFLSSANVLTDAFLFSSNARVGGLILAAVKSTKEITGRNTNLGMCLLLAPLDKANKSTIAAQGGRSMTDDRTRACWEQEVEFRPALKQILSELDEADANSAYEAIRLANPGGLGDAPDQDVKIEPTVTLLEAMKLAADRDMIARQYANGFADVFDFGVPAFLDGFERFGCIEAAIIDSQLRWLAEYPDSLIARKNGPAVAADVQARAEHVLKLGGIATSEGRRTGVALDKHLRSDGNKLNPGTTADLITACLFIALRENKVAPSAPFRWQVSDWL